MKTNISKKIVTSILALLLIPMLVITLLAGCAKQTYTVTVINGTGGGEYEAGETCTVTATVTDGQQFVRWTVDDEEVSTENPYSFEVTQDITVTAVLTDVPAPVDKYTVTVVGGTGGGDSDDDSVEAVYIDALRYVVGIGQASISMIQRRCSVGYPKAGKIIEWMENMGYISAFDGAKARKVLLTKEEFESKYGDFGE